MPQNNGNVTKDNEYFSKSDDMTVVIDALNSSNIVVKNTTRNVPLKQKALKRCKENHNKIFESKLKKSSEHIHLPQQQQKIRDAFGREQCRSNKNLI